MPNRAQLLRRIERLEHLEAPRKFDLAQVCFERQLPFVREDARFFTAVCTRRSGKTVGIAAKLLDVAIRKPGCVALYITKSRVNAKRIFWRIIKRMYSDYSLGIEDPKEAELCISLPNGSEIYLTGCVDESEIENFRGLPIGIVILDEAQSLPQFIEGLVDDALVPALMDFDGQLGLVGTPGPVPVGYFHECATSPKWAHHAWSVFDNPWIQRKSVSPRHPEGKTPEMFLAEELDRRGVTADDPKIQREWFGRWVVDLNSLVFRYSAALNAAPAPAEMHHHVLSIDFGWDDSDAIAVLGWRDDDPRLWLVHEDVMSKQTPTALMKKTQAMYDKYQPREVVADFGGLGKKIAMDLQERTGIPIEAADKNEKLAHIELLNDAMRTGLMHAPAKSRFADDCSKVEWDKKNPEKPKISERFHSDICDAVLYGWRKCQQWLCVPPEKPPAKVGTPEWADEMLAATLKKQEEADEQEFAANQKEQDESDGLNAWL